MTRWPLLLFALAACAKSPEPIVPVSGYETWVVTFVKAGRDGPEVIREVFADEATARYFHEYARLRHPEARIEKSEWGDLK